MFNKVFHTTYEEGLVTNLSNGVLEIYFNGEMKAISTQVWGTHLFFNKADCNVARSEDPALRKKVLDKYAAYRNWVEPDTYIRDHRIEMIPFFGRVRRNIVILSNKKVKHGRQIVGLDRYTRTIVNIVDTNGLQYNCHSDDTKWEDIQPLTEISAEFQFCLGEVLNTIRITSDFQKRGIADLRQFRGISPGRKEGEFPLSFKTIEEYCTEAPDSRGFILVHFTGTEVSPYRDSYQIKMGKNFVNMQLSDYKFDANKSWYYGFALLRFRPGKNKTSFFAEEVFDEFLNKEGLEQRKREGMIMGETVRDKKMDNLREYGPMECDSTDDSVESEVDEDEIQNLVWSSQFYEDDNEKAYVYEEIDREMEDLNYEYCGDTMGEYSEYEDDLAGYFPE